MAKTKSTKPKTTSTTKTRTRRSKRSTSTNRLSGEEIREMKRLAEMLPPMMRTANPRIDPTILIHNVTQYINVLTSTLVSRVQSGQVSPDVLQNLPIPDPSANVCNATFRSHSSVFRNLCRQQSKRS
ncbi:hypothetical protein M3Y94_00242700 [Aphelenchoides besseyi]|nr:hypothetical protein M3Y94_00242700 [Aphelenchoides besseyi]KAI6236333.1 hypothetical protein M3Y95_00146300 [Aphelenchoides besseyi]